MTSTEAQRVIIGSLVLVNEFDEKWVKLHGLVIGVVPPDHDYFVVLLGNSRTKIKHYSNLWCT